MMNKILICLVVLFLLFGCTINTPTQPADETNVNVVVDGTVPLPNNNTTETIVEHADLAQLFLPWVLATDAENLCVIGGGTFVYEHDDVGCYGVGKVDCGTADAVMARTQCEATGAVFTCSLTQLTCAYN